MFRKMVVGATLVAALVGLPNGALAQQMMPEGLPPGIQMQAQPMMMDMMEHMQVMGMSPQQMQTMMADMEMMSRQLPPGVFLEMLRLMNQMDAESMMEMHAVMHSGDMSSMSPGSLMATAHKLAGP